MSYFHGIFTGFCTREKKILPLRLRLNFMAGSRPTGFQMYENDFKEQSSTLGGKRHKFMMFPLQSKMLNAKNCNIK